MLFPEAAVQRHRQHAMTAGRPPRGPDYALAHTQVVHPTTNLNVMLPVHLSVNSNKQPTPATKVLLVCTNNCQLQQCFSATTFPLVGCRQTAVLQQHPAGSGHAPATTTNTSSLSNTLSAQLLSNSSTNHEPPRPWGLHVCCPYASFTHAWAQTSPRWQTGERNTGCLQLSTPHSQVSRLMTDLWSLVWPGHALKPSGEP